MSAGPHDGRFAPSPTGDLHLGNLRTALAAWLFARSAGGRFLVRVDDLDPDRSRPEHAERQLRDLAAIGLDWDEAPAWQSERRARHELALASLRDSGLTYPCFCTRAEVRAAASAPNAPLAGSYPGTCAELAPSTSARRVDAGEPWCERLRAGGAELTFDDRILGRVSGIVDDLVVQRRDGVPAYNVACVVDDHEQGVGEVVRGDDLASSTPAQAFIAQALGLPPVSYAHVPIVLAPDGSRLAKRHGAVTLDDVAARGTSAGDVQRLLLASLGVDAPDLAAAASAFDPARIPRSPVTFDSHLGSFGDLVERSASPADGW